MYTSQYGIDRINTERYVQLHWQNKGDCIINLIMAVSPLYTYLHNLWDIYVYISIYTSCCLWVIPVWHPRGTHYFELLFCCSREGTSLHAYSSVKKFMPVINYTPIKYSGHMSMILVQQCHVNHLSFRFIDVMISVVLPSFTTRP